MQVLLRTHKTVLQERCYLRSVMEQPAGERCASALVLGQDLVDAVGPGQDAAGEVRDVGVALLLEEEGGALAAGSGFAVDDDLGGLGEGEAVELVGEIAYGDQRRADVDDLVFVGLADVEDEGRGVAVDAGLELLDGHLRDAVDDGEIGRWRRGS